MKLFKRIAAIVLAATLVLAMGMVANAATVTIKPPTDVASDANNSYKVYKVFDAEVNPEDTTMISYKLCEGDTLSQAMKDAGFSVDSAGNVQYSKDELDEAAIAAIAAYVTEADLVDTVTTTGTKNGTSKDIGYGYFYITTSTGTVVTIDSTNDNPTVNDKNTVPGLDKKITNTNAEPAEDGMAGTIFDDKGKEALAELGKEVEYTATITVGKGAKGYVFHDKMGTGLDFVGVVSVTLSNTPNDFVEPDTWYTIDTNPEDQDTLDIKFDDILPEGSTITIVYKGKVNDGALEIDTGKNTAVVKYGDSNSNNHTPPSETHVYNATLTIVKSDGKNQPLAGAGFVLMNTSNSSYYYLDTQADPTSVHWIESIDEATEYVSGDDGKVDPFTGLVDGTYTLIEKTVPSGYNKVADTSIIIKAKDSSTQNLRLTASVINQSGQELPSTGGIGTTIFYVVGAILVLGSGVILVSKRRMAR